jgi:putative transposase
VHGEQIFRDDADRLLFLRLLGESSRKQAWICHAFCLMGTHYHLLLETTRERLSHGLHRLNSVYAQLFNRRHGRSGHLFGDRFHAWVIADEDHLRAARQYVFQNPVRAGLCARAADWPWSGRSPAKHG